MHDGIRGASQGQVGSSKGGARGEQVLCQFSNNSYPC